MKRFTWNNPRGQDLVEYALIIPIFMAFVIVLLDLGRATYYYSTIHNAAREGARAGVVRPPIGFNCDGESDPSVIYNAARSKTTGLDNMQVLTTIICPDEHTLQVAVSYSFNPITPFVEIIIGAPTVDLTSQATMRLER